MKPHFVRSIAWCGLLMCLLAVVVTLGHRRERPHAPEFGGEYSPSSPSIANGNSPERLTTLTSLPSQHSEVPEQPPTELNPAPEPPPNAVAVSLTVEEIIDDLARQAGLTEVAAQLARQAIFDAGRASQQLARATRVVSDLVDSNARVYDFATDPAAATAIRSRLAISLEEVLPTEAAATLLTAIEEAAEGDPSLDLLARHRRIVILPREEGDGWQVLDQTFSGEGSLVAANTVFLGVDEDYQLVWPDEYQVLLSE